MLMTTELIEFIDRCKMTDYNDILILDYRGYLIDAYLEDYFNLQIQNIDAIINSKINHRKLTYQTKFIEKLEELIKVTNLECIVDKNYHSHST